MPPIDFFTLISQAPAAILAASALWAHWKGLWVWGKDKKKCDDQVAALTKAIEEVHAANAAKLSRLETEREIYLRLPLNPRSKE